MPARIRAFCAETGQAGARDPAEVVRCVLESLALKHAQTVELLAAVDRRRGRRGARRRRRRPQRAALPVDGRRRRAARCWPGPAEATELGNLLVAGDRARRARVARRGARGRAGVVRAAVYEPRDDAAWSEARERFEAVASALPERQRWVVRPAVQGIAPPDDRWDATTAARASTRSTSLVYRSNLLGADRALANQGGGNTSAEGDRRSTTPGARRACCGSRAPAPTSPRSRPSGFAPCASTRSCRCASARRWTTPRWSRTCAAARSTPTRRGRSIETLLHAFVPARARRPHAPRRRHRAHLLAARPRARRARRSATRRCGSTTSAPASTCRGGSPSCSRQHPQATRGAARPSTGSSRGARPRATSLPQHASRSVARAAEALAQAGDGRLGLGGPRVRAASRAPTPTSCSRPRCPRCAAPCSRTPTASVLEVDRSPEAVAFASRPRDAGEVSQVGAPCPDHLIHTKHRPLVVDFDPDARSADDLRAALAAGVAAYADWYRDYYDRNLTDESRPYPIDPAGPRVVLVPGVGIVTTGGDAGARAADPRPVPPRDRRRGRGRRGGRLPLAERGRGVRDRVLAARALQARAGAAARRARRADRASSPAAAAASAARPRAAWPSSARTSSWPTSTPTAPPPWPTRSSPPRGARRALAVHVDVTERGRRRRRWCAAPSSRTAASTSSSSQRRHRHERAASSTRRVDELEKNHAVLVRGYFLAARETWRVLVAAGPRRRDRLRRLQERARRGRQRRRVLVGQGRLAAPRALPRRGGRQARHPRQHRQPRRGHRGLEHLVVGVEGRARHDLRPRRGGPARLLPRPHDARRRRPTRRTSPRPSSSSPPARSAKSTGNILNVDGGVAAAYPR